MPTSRRCYFFCGIGGSGMLPLAVLLKKKGHEIAGSDRAYDQGNTPEKFNALKKLGIHLFLQDGSGLNEKTDVLVVSSAVEGTIPDVQKAQDLSIPIITRGALLAECFNAADRKIAVAGTSGKSTVTGMIGMILCGLRQDPTIINGGEIIGLHDNPDEPFANIRKGSDGLCVAEMDESDGSIAHYRPSVAVLNNIALDHKSIEELETLFRGYLDATTQCVVANYGNERVRHLCAVQLPEKIMSYALEEKYAQADLIARNIRLMPSSAEFILFYNGGAYPVCLPVTGHYNVENALAALGACIAAGFSVTDCIEALRGFRGIHRRMEHIGTRNGISVIDDFAHNPDKIAASLRALKAFDGRLIVMFQPHGFGPLRLMGDEMVSVFSGALDQDDVLIMPEVYYAGGTVERSVTARDIIDRAQSCGVNAHWFETRADAAVYMRENSRGGDRIVVMGARDDTLHTYAKDLLSSL